MNCRKARSLILTSYDDELSHSARKELLTHVENCTRCQREKLLIEQMRAGLRSMTAETLSDDFNNKLFARIYSAPRTEEPKVQSVPSAFVFHLKNFMPYLATACALILVVVVTVTQLSPGLEQSDQMVQSEKARLEQMANNSADPWDYFDREYASGSRGLAFSVAKLESLQVAASMKDNRMMLDRLRLDAARKFGGFNIRDSFQQYARDNFNGNRHYILPVIRNASSARTPH